MRPNKELEWFGQFCHRLNRATELRELDPDRFRSGLITIQVAPSGAGARQSEIRPRAGAWRRFIADMADLAAVQAAAPRVMPTISFAERNRYADDVSSLDTGAAGGIGGMIAGKVLSSTGFLVVALLVLKKGAVLILPPAAWWWKKIKGRKGGGSGPIT